MYGVGPVRELVRARAKTIAVVYVDPGRADKHDDPVAQLVKEARTAGVPIELRSRTQLDAMSDPDARHQGVIAVAGELAYAELDDIVAAAASRNEPALVVALDGVQDPHNLGAILRSAYLLGAHGVLVPEHRAAHVTAAVTKASAGASELVRIAQVKNLVRALGELKDAGLWLAAVHDDPAARPLQELDGTMPLALVLGGEGQGVRTLVARTCDFHAVIPMSGRGVGSFNVSVAAAIALYEVARQRAARAPR
ncbi:MAG TPA: 23S rRNA (guanosine(2251)-2'-O)-methyltransferase RlmB [Kofleriaceae bacterium]|nr:23S rRNA (guanosine(2251)-2'-O)-methyltransferase RlmB [Kofleriaceae bacterium]